MRLGKLSIPTYFNNEFLRKILALNNEFGEKNICISELYGSLKGSIWGSGRESDDLPKVTFKDFKNHIEDLHKYNFKFNYLLNASCLGSIEYTKEGRKKLFNFLDNLAGLNIDIITVSIPYLVELIKKNYPEIKICASTICYIDSVEKAKFYEELGVDKITLDIDINRNFKLLKKIRDKVKVELGVIVNSPCLLKCPMKYSHYNFTSHYNVPNLNKNLSYFGGCLAGERCLLIKLKNPRDFISAPWIRPEDIEHYFDLGINYIKIAGRELPEDFIINCAKAYIEKKSPDNLTSLLMIPYRRYGYHEPLFIFIDNSKLSKFLEFFKEKDINCNKFCDKCNYCEEVAKEAVIIDDKLREDYIKYIQNEIKKKY